MADWWDSLVTNLGNTASNIAGNPMLIPAVGTAVQSWNNANNYDELAKNIKTEANPFGQYRGQYAQQLSDLYKDPSSLVNTPGYKFRLSQGAGIIGGKNGAEQSGYGNEFRAMQDYAQGLASTEFDNEVKRLSGLAGANIGPEASVQGQIGLANAAVGQRGTALQALGTLLGQQPNTTINNGSGGLGNAGNGSWMPNGNYKLPNGDEVDVAKLSAAARLGDKDAIAMLTKISGGAVTDQNIRDLTTGDIRDGTGTLTGDPYNPDGGGYYPPGFTDGRVPGGGFIGDTDTQITIPEVTGNLDNWFEWSKTGV